jgi:FAD/FMN-containing dehydrogenase
MSDSAGNGRVADELRASFDGDVIGPEDAGYDEARKVFNGMFDKRPAAVARCASTGDVVAAVNLARERQLAVAVRSGGHSVAGMSICDDGLLIDLAGLKGIDVDPDRRRATAGGGVLWGEFDAATQEHGLHTPGGRITTTGVGGFTTGGGFGWTSSKYGLTSDNLVSAEVVTADGSVLTASEDENEDLFWGIRGGGGNFGIVTQFEFELHPLGPIVLAGLMMFPIDRAAEIARAWRDYVDDAPDELSTAMVIITAPPEEFVPEHLRMQPIAGMAVLYVGDPEEGAPVVQPLKDLGPEVDLVQPMPYTAFEAILDAGAPSGKRNYWRGEYLASLPDEAIDTWASRANPPLSPLSQIIFFRIGQAVSAVDDEATAFSHREAKYMFHPICMWEDPADDERQIEFAKGFAEAMRPFAIGAPYLNFTPEVDRVRDAFGAEKYERLVALKDRYDPDNLFRLNQNIKPSRTAGEPALA